MDHSAKILQELETVSPFLAAMEKVNVFRSPEGYFNDFPERMVTYVLAEAEEISFPKNDTLQAPQGYFDTLSDRILSKIKSTEEQDENEELKKLFPVVFSLKGKNVFTVPPHYFERFGSTLLHQLKMKPAKIVSINKAGRWWKYAAAAVVMAAMAAGSLFNFNNSRKSNEKSSVFTASNETPGYIQSSFQYKTPEQINEGIATLSDDEIIKYLEKHGNILDNEALANGVDTKELPAATDYLTDDNALNNYLKKIDTKITDKTTP